MIINDTIIQQSSNETDLGNYLTKWPSIIYIIFTLLSLQA